MKELIDPSSFTYLSLHWTLIYLRNCNRICNLMYDNTNAFYIIPYIKI